jgi:hypothetical protein
VVAAAAVVVAVVVAATGSGAGGSGTRPRGDRPATAPRNPYLADSGVPIGHVDSAQTTSTPIAGPTGPSGELGPDDLTYQHLGPGHFGIAISPEYPDGERVIWSNGGDRISKLDAGSLAVLAELALPGKALQTAAQADAELEVLDREQGEALGNAAVTLAGTYLQGLAGVYYALDADNTLYVGGATSIIAYGDDGADRSSPVTVQREWTKPADVGGNFVGVNMTFDGHLVLATDEGWVVAVTRDFTSYDTIRIVGAEAAVAHNAEVRAAGARPGQADFVRNSVAVDRDGGIYVVSHDHLHKVVWDGTVLSTDPRDGAWSARYLDGTGNGSGATPALLGFGGDDRLVVITDGERLMNVVAFWRDAIPRGWERLPGAPSRRIAGQLPADMGDPGLQAIQTEQSVVVGGNGALVVNNDPASIPPGFPAAGVRVLAGYAATDPAFTPHGLQKFEWDERRRELREAWANRRLTSANAVPVVSLGSDVVYTVGVRDGQWTVEGIDWGTGRSRFHWVTGSARYNTGFSGMNLDQDGRVVHTTPFGIVRYDPGPTATR